MRDLVFIENEDHIYYKQDDHEEIQNNEYCDVEFSKIEQLDMIFYHNKFVDFIQNNDKKQENITENAVYRTENHHCLNHNQ